MNLMNYGRVGSSSDIYTGNEGAVLVRLSPTAARLLKEKAQDLGKSPDRLAADIIDYMIDPDSNVTDSFFIQD